uniref:Uncharacterized protein n=1 Tax=Globisporangium ultimum (strain ATCC 200006 / CBS 805.95 / DAOM BR144) TaxID=431595 RepID=K3X9J3_GLOUD
MEASKVRLSNIIAKVLRDPGRAYVVPDPAAQTKSYRTKAPVQVLSTKRLPRRSLKLSQIIRLVHRFVILCAAIGYIAVSFCAAVDSVRLLREETSASIATGSYPSDALRRFIGATTLRESPFVTQALQNDTTPRNATIYYTSTSMSFERCSEMSLTVQALYSTPYLQSMYAAIARDTAYNLTFLAASTTELIVPLVDCTSFLMQDASETMANFNFLARRKHDIDDVYIVSVTMVNQIYKISIQNEEGPAGAATLTFINDLRVHHVDSYFITSLGYPFEPFNFRVYDLVGWTEHGSWILQNVPTQDPTELIKEVRTSTRSGFYMKSEGEQLNMFTEHWVISPTDPIHAIVGPDWRSKTTVYDAWAWAHLLQVVFGCNLLASLVVLVIVSYRNFLAGKLWIGDAFVAVTNEVFLRFWLVLISWYFNGFWALYEFCIYDANQVSPQTTMTIFESIMFADLLTMYLSICGVLGVLFRERIDPCLSMLCFWVGFANRIKLIRWSSSTADTISTYAGEFYNLGSPDRLEGQTKISPMRFWTLHELKHVPADIVFAVLTPIFGTLVLILLFILGRKIYRHYYPDPMRVERASGQTASKTGKSGNTDTANRDNVAGKSVLTLFEIATGAKLANRYGLLAEYDNCMFIKGMKFATPDGIYSSGFVIVNQKYLVQAKDIWAILLMKILRVRYTNLYMYEVNGSTVDQTARLVYPSTFTLMDLLNLNTSILS